MTATGVSPDAPILVAVDFSSDSELAFAWAVDAARAFGVPLVCLHVIHDPAESPGYYRRAGQKRSERIEQAASEMLDEFVERMRGKLPAMQALPAFRTTVAVGLPVTRILEVAEQVGARLIALGGKGRTALSDLLLGSKVERVARLSRIPVAIVKSGAGIREAD